MDTIETKRLILRPFSMQDWPDMLELAIDWSHAPGPGFDKWPTAEEEIKSLTEYFSNDGRYFAVVLKVTKRVIGLLALNGIDDKQQMDLGHVILTQFQDNEHDREALEAMVNEIFKEDGVKSIVTRNAPEHAAQLAPLKALGFQPVSAKQQGELEIARADWQSKRG